MRPKFFSREHLLGEVNTSHGDLILLTYCYVSGMLDAAAFYNWGIFVAMQTGNTIILCLSSARLPASQPYAYGSTLTALVSFLFGAVLTFHVSRLLGSKKRLVLFANMLIQGLCIALSAGLITGRLIPVMRPDLTNPESSPYIMGGIAPLGFQTGMQISTSRILGFAQEIPVNVLTSTYAALAADTNFFAAANAPRNRRLAAVVMFFAGGLCSTWILKQGPGTILCVWLGAGIKLLAAFAAFVLLPYQEPAKTLPK